MLPLSGKAINKSLLPFATTSSMTIAKSFSNVAKRQLPPSASTAIRSTLSCHLPRKGLINNYSWLPTFRSQSSSRNTRNSHNNTSTIRGHSGTNTTGNNDTLSTLSNIFAAGIGTFASTLVALYLATIVETSAHEFLYEYFPHWYGDVPTESLPHCLMNQELARRVTGVVVMNRIRGVGTEDSEERIMLMGMDGWVEQECETHCQKQRDEKRLTTTSSSAWEKTVMDKRARIICNEEDEFSRGFGIPTSTTSSLSSLHPSGKVMMMSGKTTNRFMEKVQAEASRKFQDQLASIAMTA